MQINIRSNSKKRHLAFRDGKTSTFCEVRIANKTLTASRLARLAKVQGIGWIEQTAADHFRAAEFEKNLKTIATKFR